MRKVGVWEGLGVAAFMYCVLLLLPPLLIKMKFRKGRFGQLTLAWSFLALCATAFLAPVSGWMNDRGSFVPALVWGPESAVVQQVVVEKLEWGEGWKKRPV